MRMKSGDSDAVLEAQDKLTNAKLRAESVNNFKPFFTGERDSCTTRGIRTTRPSGYT
jgi:hypothetical protein